jgi:hypothetical protein
VQPDLFAPTVDERAQALLRLRAEVLAKRPPEPYRPWKGREEWHWDQDDGRRYILCHELLDLALNLPRGGGFLPAWERYLRTHYGAELRTLFDLLEPTFGAYYATMFTCGEVHNDMEGPRLKPDGWPHRKTFQRKYTGRS